MITKDKYLIIAAGGSGSRMRKETPKQYIEINGKPIIIWTLDAFKPFVEIKNMIVVISSKHITYWNEITKYYPEYSECKISIGGPNRFYSIKAGLKQIPNNVLLAIHDAARPLVSTKTIEDCFVVASKKGSAIPIIQLDESVREKIGNSSKIINRQTLRIVQTPQVFKSELIKEAYQQTYNEMFTDDASVAEKYGVNISLSKGNIENKKITHPMDLSFASIILSPASPSIYTE